MEGNLSAPPKQKTAVTPSPTCCVTGANGYIGSWLVKLLLERGYKVHANPEKALHLLSLWNGGDRLRLFKADLLEEGSFDEAVKGCNGVFHVAASMEFNFNTNDNIESYVRSNIIDPAIKGTENLLKSCLKSKTVKRVVFTSSISTITAKDSNGDWRSVVDESCQTTIDHVLNAKASGWVYVLSKLLTEEAAFKFAHLNGNPKDYSILSAVNARMGSVALVHIEDICRAHIFLMEQTRAEGKYICCVRSCSMSELITRLAKENQSLNINLKAFYQILFGCRSMILEDQGFVSRLEAEEKSRKVPEICSRKLRDLGFNYKYEIEDIIHQTITACVDYGLLPT